MDNFITNLIKRVKEKNNEETDSYFPLEVKGPPKKVITSAENNGEKTLQELAIEAIKKVYEP